MNLIHGHASGGVPTREYITWQSMIQRCTGNKCERFSRYGGRGISVCDRWRSSFQNFLDDMGLKPNGMSIERIDVNGNYEPSNCRWATTREQVVNKTNNRLITVDGVTKCLSQWAESSGLDRSAIDMRIKRGWTEADAVSKPKVVSRAQAHPMSKFKEGHILQIVELFNAGLKAIEIAVYMRMNVNTVYGILRGRSWSSVTKIEASAQ